MVVESYFTLFFLIPWIYQSRLAPEVSVIDRSVVWTRLCRSGSRLQPLDENSSGVIERESREKNMIGDYTTSSGGLAYIVFA
jgi:hypothetical protein